MYSPRRRKTSCLVGSAWACSVSRPDGRSGMLPCSLLIQVVQLVEIFDNDDDDDDDDDQMVMMVMIKMMMIKQVCLFVCLFFKTFSSARSFDQLGRQGDMRDHSAEIPFQSFLRDIIVSSSDIGRDVHSLASSRQHFLCRPGRRPPSKVPAEGWCWKGCRGV